MPNIIEHRSKSNAKVLLIGHSSSGKTGSLLSLATAGYKLRIIDVDNKLDILRGLATDPESPYVKKNPKVAENIEFVTLTDPMKNINGFLFPTAATVWKKASELLIHWKHGSTDLGPVNKWESDSILVIDSLTMLSRAAMNFHLAFNGALQENRTSNEYRRDIGAAQNMIRNLMNLLFDTSLKCNVIVTSHIKWVSESGRSPQAEIEARQGQVDAQKPIINGFPSTIGASLSPEIPRWFNSVLVAYTTGFGRGTQHKISTKPMLLDEYLIPASTPAPLKVKPEYGLEWGLAEYFEAVRS